VISDEKKKISSTLLKARWRRRLPNKNDSVKDGAAMVGTAGDDSVTDGRHEWRYRLHVDGERDEDDDGDESVSPTSSYDYDYEDDDDDNDDDGDFVIPSR